jgi:NAD(P)H-hydrate epimerase
LVTIATHERVVNALSGQLLEATWRSLDGIQEALNDYTALLLGPGWGRAAETDRLLDNILSTSNLPPLVIDADGLNMLAEKPDWPRLLPPNTIITPHPGEMARLAGLSTAEVQGNRWGLALEKAVEWNVVLVFKGAHTLIANPEGRITALPFKTDALAKAGSGDVLAGVIVGLLAQGLSAYDAAVAGGYLHGLAGTLAAQKMGTTHSLLASEIVDTLPKALRHVANPLIIKA